MSAMSNNDPSFDHSYELPLRRRNLLLLLDLLNLLRFIAGVLLDRLGVASCHGEVHLLPGQPWGGEHASDVTLERFLLEEAGLWETGGTTRSSPSSSLTAPRYRRRRRRVALARPVDDNDDQDQLPAEGDAVCAICLAGLEEPGGLQMVVAELCSCSHAFHAACIDAWVGTSATCPLCRAPMLPTAWDEDGHSNKFVPRSPR